MSRKFWCGIALIFTFIAFSHSQTYEDLSFGVFNEANHARDDPDRFGEYLDHDVDNRFPDDETINDICFGYDWEQEDITSCRYRVETIGGREWYESAIQDLQHGLHAHGVPMLFWSPALTQQCYDLISEQGPASNYGHIGEDGSTLRERVDRYADSWTAVSEIVTYSDRYGNIGRDLIKQLLLDDGISDFSHRSTILNENWTHLGVSWGCHGVYALTCCLAFGINVETNPEYEQPLVADQVNSCDWSTELFGNSTQGRVTDSDVTHVEDAELEVVDDTVHRGELSEVSYFNSNAFRCHMNHVQLQQYELMIQN